FITAPDLPGESLPSPTSSPQPPPHSDRFSTILRFGGTTDPHLPSYHRLKFRPHTVRLRSRKRMKKYVIAVSVMLAVAAAGFYFYNAENAPASPVAATDPGVNLPPAQASPQSKVNEGVPYKDTSMLKPPTGAKVAIYVFEDLE